MIESKDNEGRVYRPAKPLESHGALAQVVCVAAAMLGGHDGNKPTHVAIQAELTNGAPVICPLLSRDIVDQVIAGLIACRDEVWPEDKHAT
jgi:hypothetical protein